MTNTTETTVQVDRLAWITSHKVGWELAPLNEGVKSRGMRQTGIC